MQKKLFFVFLTLFCSHYAPAQQQYSDSLKLALNSAVADSSKVENMRLLSFYYSFNYPDTSLYYADKILELSNKNNYDFGKVAGFVCKGEAYDRVANYATALQMAFNALEISKNLTEHRLYMMSRANELISHLYGITGDFEQSKRYAYESINEQLGAKDYLGKSYDVYFNMAYSMAFSNHIDSAEQFIKMGFEIYNTAKNKRTVHPYITSTSVYLAANDRSKGRYYLNEGLRLSKVYNSVFLYTILNISRAQMSLDDGKRDSCIYYLQESLALSQKYKYKLFELNACGFLSSLYNSINTDSTLKYLNLMLAARDEVSSDQRIQQFQSVTFGEEKRKADLENANAKYKNNLRFYFLVTIVLVFLVIAFILYRNNRNKQRANILLQQQKEKVETTLAELNATQAQLIQSEKMASLGEMTAGIAHEIQNPLNFVNNFSEVNTELIQELRAELAKQSNDRNDALAKELLNDIEQNLVKINHHGKRADAIVKGMLQHNRTGNGQKEPTNLNALADEYLRLAYHGLRAKDKSFNCTIKTDFDDAVGKINIIPQDIGRVLLNLYNNAFYALSAEALGKTDAKASAGKEAPTISVITKKIGDKIEIRVKDNGTGIPSNIIDKIFQPFFTTKPTGQGTGLGLSISYDIIKAHKGELRVETKQDEYSEFIILLPL